MRDLILCVGRVYCDLIFTGLDALPAQGKEVFAQSLTPTVGGGAFIVAAHGANLGRRSALVSRFGTDPIAMALEDQLEMSGIDLQFVERAPDAGPQVTVAMVEGSERAFLSHRAGPAEPRTLAAALAHKSATHLHIAEYATLVEIPNLITRAKLHGLTVSLDPSWDEALIHSPDLLQTCKGVDLFLPNLAEGQAITGLSAPQDVLGALAPHFPLVALKLGANGALLAAGEARFSEPARDVPVVDTTGAGDAFDAGLIDAWLTGEPPQNLLRAANTAASGCVQSVGGVSLSGERHMRAG